MRAIIIYATCEGQTERIAYRLARTMRKQGVPTDTFDVTRHDVTELAVDSYDAVVMGSSLHYAEHDPRIGWCVRQHRGLLSKIPTAFFSVSLGIVSEHYRDRSEAEALANGFLLEQDFEPSRRACFAGALRYSKYGWIKKRMMRWITEKSGRKTSMDRDYEYTDWNEVDAFAIDFSKFIHQCRQPAPTGPWIAGAREPHREYVVAQNPESMTSE